jgi:hypothetical protein
MAHSAVMVTAHALASRCLVPPTLVRRLARRCRRRARVVLASVARRFALFRSFFRSFFLSFFRQMHQNLRQSLKSELKEQIYGGRKPIPNPILYPQVRRSVGLRDSRRVAERTASVARRLRISSNRTNEKTNH